MRSRRGSGRSSGTNEIEAAKHSSIQQARSPNVSKGQILRYRLDDSRAQDRPAVLLPERDRLLRQPPQFHGGNGTVPWPYCPLDKGKQHGDALLAFREAPVCSEEVFALLIQDNYGNKS
jgi:hypothetical protein